MLSWCGGVQDFIEACEASEDNLVYDIFKDVRRTRGSMPFFRELSTQCSLIRILYTYSKAHPEISYNQVLSSKSKPELWAMLTTALDLVQGMGELLATILYLLHIEQWPSSSTERQQLDDLADTTRASMSTSSSFEKISSDDGDSDDASYVYVESFMDVQSDDTYLDEDAFLKLAPFSGNRAGKHTEYVIVSIGHALLSTRRLTDRATVCSAPREAVVETQSRASCRR